MKRRVWSGAWRRCSADRAGARRRWCASIRDHALVRLERRALHAHAEPLAELHVRSAPIVHVHQTCRRGPQRHDHARARHGAQRPSGSDRHPFVPLCRPLCVSTIAEV